MSLNLSAKKTVVAEINDVASKAISAVVADYRGLTVNQMTQLRAEARKAGVYFKVIRNRLAKRALENTDFVCLADQLIGPSCIALSLQSPGDAARLLKNHSKSFGSLEIKVLSVAGKLYDAKDLDAVASLPTREEALAKLMFVMKAPIEKFVRTLAAPHTKLFRTIVAIKDKKSG